MTLKGKSLCFEPANAGERPQVLWRLTCLRSYREGVKPLRCTEWFLKKSEADKEARRLNKLDAKKIVIAKYTR